MKSKLLTLKELKGSWWWRDKEKRQKIAREVDWNNVKEAARNYELLRRSLKGKKFTRSYLELTPDERTIIHVLWMYRYPYFERFAEPSQYQERGWMPIYPNQVKQWNLRLADSLLAKEFIRQIRLNRKIQKVRAKHPLKGQKYRGVSWKLVEILDRNLNKIGKLNASQRHSASTARRMAEKLVLEYKRALAREKRKPNPLSESPCFYNDQNDSEEPCQ